MDRDIASVVELIRSGELSAGPGVGGVARGDPRLGGSPLAHRFLTASSSLGCSSFATPPRAVRRSGEGHKPGVAVDAAGTAYVAWNGPEPRDTSLRFCRLPRGASACAGQSRDRDRGRRFALAPVRARAPRRPGARSTATGYPRGSTRSCPRDLDGRRRQLRHGDVVGPRARFDEAVTGPGDTISTVTFADQAAGSSRTCAVRPPGAGAAPLRDRPLQRHRRPRPTRRSRSSPTGPRRRPSASTAGRDVNDAATWTAPVGIGYADYPKLAGGPVGLFLLPARSGGVIVRRWNGLTFRPDVLGAGDDAQATSSRTRRASARRLAAHRRRRVPPRPRDLRRRRGLGRVTARCRPTTCPDAVVAAPDHVGVAVWESRQRDAQIRISAVGPGLPLEFAKTVVLRPISGTVKVKVRGAPASSLCNSLDDVPFGSTVDAKRGRLALSSRPSKTGAWRPAVGIRSGAHRTGRPTTPPWFARPCVGAARPLAGRLRRRPARPRRSAATSDLTRRRRPWALDAAASTAAFAARVHATAGAEIPQLVAGPARGSRRRAASVGAGRHRAGQRAAQRRLPGRQPRRGCHRRGPRSPVGAGCPRRGAGPAPTVRTPRPAPAGGPARDRARTDV